MKTVLITGASSGIGYELALAYAAQGCKVYAGGRSAERLKKLTEKDNNIIAFECDLTDKATLLAQSKNLPKLDLVILNAGDCEYINDPINFDSDLFERIIKINLISVAYCLEAFLKHINQGGQLAITSSSACFLPLPRAEAYGASKAAVTYLAKTLKIDLKKYGIDVSVIHPGFVETPLTDKNDFPMPGRISSQAATTYIMKGLAKRKLEINFPRTFTFTMKLIASLPNFVWHKLASRMS